MESEYTCVCIYIYYKEIYYKGLAHVILEAAMSKSAVWPWPQDAGEPMVQLKFKASRPLCSGAEASLFVLFGPSTDQTRPTHLLESDLPTQSSPIQMSVLSKDTLQVGT